LETKTPNLTGPVRNIVGIAAGGATDTTALLIGQCLSERLGVPPETVVIAPASSAAAPTIEAPDVGGGPGAEAAIQAITRFMRPINYLGLPVLEIPAGQSRDGLPIGLQLIGRPFGDETAIAPWARLPNRYEPPPPHPGFSMTQICRGA
jgi:hypothetical protein